MKKFFRCKPMSGEGWTASVLLFILLTAGICSAAGSYKKDRHSLPEYEVLDPMLKDSDSLPEYGVLHPNVKAYVRLRPVSSQLTAPRAVALDSANNLYVVESTANLLHVMNAAGVQIRSFGNLDKPLCVAVDGLGRVVVGNAGRKNVEVYDPNLTLLFKLGTGDGEFSLPNSIAADQSGLLYVTDSNADKIKVYNPDGTFRFSFGTSGSTAAKFHFPVAIAVDNTAQELYVIDQPVITTRNGSALGARVQVFTLTGVYKRGFGNYGQGDGLLTRPQGIVVNGGKVYITDSYQQVVEIFDSIGTFQATVYDLDNPMRSPLGIATNGMGMFYIASMNTGRVEVYSISQ